MKSLLLSAILVAIVKNVSPTHIRNDWSLETQQAMLKEWSDSYNAWLRCKQNERDLSFRFELQHKQPRQETDVQEASYLVYQKRVESAMLYNKSLSLRNGARKYVWNQPYNQVITYPMSMTNCEYCINCMHIQCSFQAEDRVDNTLDCFRNNCYVDEVSCSYIGC